MQKNQNAKETLDITASQKEVLSEIQEDLNIREQRRRMFPRAALLGLCAGLVASFFRIALTGANAFRKCLALWHPEALAYGS